MVNTDWQNLFFRTYFCSSLKFLEFLLCLSSGLFLGDAVLDHNLFIIGVLWIKTNVQRTVVGEPVASFIEFRVGLEIKNSGFNPPNQSLCLYMMSTACITIKMRKLFLTCDFAML